MLVVVVVQIMDIFMVVEICSRRDPYRSYVNLMR